MIGSLLIANRGEIACRIIRTARDMGVRTVAVYSDADARALHVRQADVAVHIGGSPASESYLRGDRIIAVALESGAEAIHPGYGFLSENSDFAQAVIDAGLIWVGPRPESIRAMGRKDEAKRLMQAAGVPVTPGYLGENQSLERLAFEAEAIGWPVLIKAVAGGGGKGMRRVDAAADFADALAAARREATSSFGDDRVLLEKYVLSPRHIEVQLFGDTHGNLVHLFERDCSLQRRHQKVIEEAPAPGMDADTQAAVCAAALQAGRAVDYVGAGTVEFIADASEGLRADRIWFMEMNTRLQVEHPVTEAITGVDLVEWQLRVASGEPLPKRQEELNIEGHAIEARLYAEDPAQGFRPSVGRLEHFVVRSDDEEPTDLRIDSGVDEGSDISPYYDPMIAKLICHAADRQEAARGLANLAGRVETWPVRTNATFLHALLVNPTFRQGQVHTGLIADLHDEIVFDVPAHPRLLDAAAAAMVGRGPFQSLNGFRLNAAPSGRVWMMAAGETHVGDFAAAWPPNRAPWLRLTPKDNAVFAAMQGRTWKFEVPRASSAGGGKGGDGAVLSPMPGRITAVAVAPGDAVTAGQTLITLEAMKMEQALVAPFDGIVADLTATEGAQVDEGVVLVRVEKAA